MSDTSDGYNIGYARNIGSLPSRAQQIENLKRFRCQEIYVEPNRSIDRELQMALSDVREGDTFVVQRLICISHSTEKIKSAIQQLQQKNVGLHILDHPSGTAVTYGNSELQFLLGLIDLKRKQRSEETLAGLATAMRLGRRGGRPIELTSEVEATARALIKTKHYSMTEIAKIIGVSRSSLYNLGLATQKIALRASDVSPAEPLATGGRTKNKGRPRGTA